MTAPFSARRRADAFHAALSGDPLDEQDVQRFADLLALVDDLRALPEVEPRPEYAADLRGRLLAEADTALLPQSQRSLSTEEQRLVLPMRSPARDRRLAVILGGAAVVGATTSMAAAAHTALPGDSLYPVKRAIEDARSGLARSDAAHGDALLANAGDRLDEVDALAADGSPARLASVAPTLEAFSAQAGEGADALFAAYDASGDEAAVTAVRQFAGSSMDRLVELERVLPDSARPDLVEAARGLAAIDDRAARMCASCGGATTLPPFVLSAGATRPAMATLIVSAAADPELTRPHRDAPPAPGPSQEPLPISGQDVEGIEVPDLQVPPLSSGAPVPTTPSAPTKLGTPVTAPTVPKVDVTKPVTTVTDLLTGASADIPVVGGVLQGTGTTVDGTVDQLQGTLDATGQGLLP